MSSADLSQEDRQQQGGSEGRVRDGQLRVFTEQGRHGEAYGGSLK